jgi:hypothetical protein
MSPLCDTLFDVNSAADAQPHHHSGGVMTPEKVPVSQQSSIPSQFEPEIICLHLHHFSTRIIAAWLETRTQRRTSHSSVARFIRRKADEEASRCVGSKVACALDKLQSDLSDDVECLRILQEDLRFTGDLMEASAHEPKRRSEAKNRELSQMRQFRLLQFKFRLSGMSAHAALAKASPAFFLAEQDPAAESTPKLSPEAVAALIEEANSVTEQVLAGKTPQVAAGTVAQLRADLVMDTLPTTPESLQAAQAEGAAERPGTGATSPSTQTEPSAAPDIVLSQELIADFARWRLAQRRGEKAELKLSPENTVKVRQVMAIWKEVLPPDLLSPEKSPAADGKPLAANEDMPAREAAMMTG